jgi:YHS domain-containing protein
MKIALAFLAGLIAIGTALALPDQKKDTPTSQPSTKPVKPVNQYCAVQKEYKIDPNGPTVMYNEKLIGFCCEDCLPEFKKNPEKYMKDLK